MNGMTAALLLVAFVAFGQPAGETVQQDELPPPGETAVETNAPEPAPAPGGTSETEASQVKNETGEPAAEPEQQIEQVEAESPKSGTTKPVAAFWIVLPGDG